MSDRREYGRRHALATSAGTALDRLQRAMSALRYAPDEQPRPCQPGWDHYRRRTEREVSRAIGKVQALYNALSRDLYGLRPQHWHPCPYCGGSGIRRDVLLGPDDPVSPSDREPSD